MLKQRSAAAALCTLAALFAGVANATAIFDPTVSTSNRLDASTLRLDGTLRDINGDTQPWVAQLYAFPGECVRFFVTGTTSGFDAKITAISPSGIIYRDDDSGGSFRPLVKIAGAPEQGWYTVQVAEFAGRPVQSNFTLRYGRYNAGNANCAVPTVPEAMSTQKVAERAADGEPAITQ